MQYILSFYLYKTMDSATGFGHRVIYFLIFLNFESNNILFLSLSDQFMSPFRSSIVKKEVTPGES